MPDRPLDGPPQESAAAKKLRGALMVFVFGMIPVIGILVFLNLTKEQDADRAYQDAADQPLAEPDAGTTVADTSSLPDVTFVDVTSQTGVTFNHSSESIEAEQGDPIALPNRQPSPNDLRGGVGVFDYDNDGNQDVLLVGSECRLFRGNGDFQFTDVTEPVGLKSRIGVTGVAIGDYDGDGDRDLYLTSDGKNRLLRNDDGAFTDVTESAGCGGAEQTSSTGACFVDYDNDGSLDLIVCHEGGYESGRAVSLYRNEGDGRFDDSTLEAGIVFPSDEAAFVRTIAVNALDFNRDGFQDFCVTQLFGPNVLWENQRDGTFVDVARQTGLTTDESVVGSLGLDSSVFREDETIAIVIANSTDKPNSFFIAPPRRSAFVDAAGYNGFGSAANSQSAIGAFFFDVDLDGRLDVLTTHGGYGSSSEPAVPQVFWNAGRDAEAELIRLENLGESFERPINARGASFGDFDNDGDQDLVVLARGETAKFFRNDQSSGHHYLRLRLIGKRPSNDAVGAQVTVIAGGQKQTRIVHSARGYLSQSEIELTFGLGEISKVDQVTVRWPDGASQVVSITGVDDQVEVRQE
ncbi:CRTAC1 family protein [Roseiconus lacunae]|uniref:CRTAC1 family protein n=1 Tax=Roseiconus lacunae TaxID=2605694 RepID=UPI0011F23283|nr:CRTAC1 family protein [Roseiconus lacunae]